MSRIRSIVFWALIYVTTFNIGYTLASFFYGDGPQYVVTMKIKEG